MPDTTAAAALEAGQTFDPRFTRDMTLAQRMHLVMTRVDYIQKDKPKAAEEGGKKLKYSIVSHDAVTALIRQHTVACGIIYFPCNFEYSRDGNMTVVKLTVRFINIDNSDDAFDVEGLGYGVDPGDKGPGKAISYAVKYALLKGFGLETGDDPDLDQEVQHRSTLHQRLDQLETEIIAVASADELRSILTRQDAIEIRQAVMSRDPAEFRRLNQVVKKEAARVGLDMGTV